MTTARPTTILVTDSPVRGRLGGSDRDIPILHFLPFVEGVFDVQPTGTPAERAAWLEALAEQATKLAAQVRQADAFATYPESVGA